MDIRRDEKQLDLGPVRLKVPESWKKDLVITGKSAFTRVATGWSSVSEASDELGHTTREEFPGADWWEETGFDGVTKSFFQYVLAQQAVIDWTDQKFIGTGIHRCRFLYNRFSITANFCDTLNIVASKTDGTASISITAVSMDSSSSTWRRNLLLQTGTEESRASGRTLASTSGAEYPSRMY